MNSMDGVIAACLGSPIAFHRIFARVAGGAANGLFLSQLWYWHDKGGDPDGWIYKTQQDWEAETMLTRREQETARQALRERGILEECKRGLPAKLYYRLNTQMLFQAIRGIAEASTNPANKDGGNVHPCMAENANQECTKAPDKDGGNVQTCLAENATPVCANPPGKNGGIRRTITKTTSQITSENTQETTTQTPAPPQAAASPKEDVVVSHLHEIPDVPTRASEHVTRPSEAPGGSVRPLVGNKPPVSSPGPLTTPGRRSEAPGGHTKALVGRGTPEVKGFTAIGEIIGDPVKAPGNVMGAAAKAAQAQANAYQPDPSVVKALVEAGVEEDVAWRLASQHEAVGILRRIAVWDKGKGAFGSTVGAIVRAIEGEWDADAKYEAQAKREQRQASLTSVNEQRQAREGMERAEFLAAWRALAVDEQTEVRKRALALLGENARKKADSPLFAGIIEGAIVQIMRHDKETKQ